MFTGLALLLKWFRRHGVRGSLGQYVEFYMKIKKSFHFRNKTSLFFRFRNSKYWNSTKIPESYFIQEKVEKISMWSLKIVA